MSISKLLFSQASAIFCSHFQLLELICFRWIYLLITFILVGFIKFSIGILIDRRPIPRSNLLSSSFLESFGLMIKQRVVYPRAASMKLLEVFLVVSMMFIGQYYQTEMNSKLTAPKKAKVPFLHQDEVLGR